MNKILAFLLLLLSVTVVSANPVDYGKRTSIGKNSNLSLKPLQIQGFKKFQKAAGYFGAMYANDTIDEWHAVYNFHSLRTAHKVAKQFCEIRSKGIGECQLAAVSFPKGRSSNEQFPGGLGVNARNDYFEDYTQKKVEGKFGAFAISGGFERGASWFYANRADAIATALAACESDVANGLVGLGIGERNWIKKSGILRCSIIDVWNDE